MTNSIFRVAIDATCLGRNKTGNETYIRGLLFGLEELNHSDFQFVILTTIENKAKRSSFFEWHDIPLGNFLSRNFVTIPRLLNRLNISLYHASYWMKFWGTPYKTLLMIHDMSFLGFPSGFRKHERFVYEHLIRTCAKRAHHIVTVSDFSKTEIAKFWNISPENISVTYNGVDRIFQPVDKKRPTQAVPYILYVGNLHPRKNLVRLLKAFIHLKNTHAIPHSLQIVGQASWMYQDIFQCVRDAGLHDSVNFTGYIEQSALVERYQNAAVTVYPSLYEGFGLPVVEAMTCGSPVVTSDSTSLPEISGGAALLVDSLSERDIAEKILSVLSDPALQETLISRGLARVSQFSWLKCAQSTTEAYKKALKMPSSSTTDSQLLCPKS